MEGQNMVKIGRNYTEEFKRQIVDLVKAGKTPGEIEREYKVTKTSVREWVRRYGNSGEFGAEANRSEEDKELRQLRKENKQLRMENDILKQAALILGRKDV
jgi:transposase